MSRDISSLQIWKEADFCDHFFLLSFLFRFKPRTSRDCIVFSVFYFLQNRYIRCDMFLWTRCVLESAYFNIFNRKKHEHLWSKQSNKVHADKKNIRFFSIHLNFTNSHQNANYSVRLLCKFSSCVSQVQINTYFFVLLILPVFNHVNR